MGNLIPPSQEEILEKIRPKHIDFDVLRILINRMDDAEDGTVLLVEVADRPLEEIMDQAMRAAVDIAKSKDDPKKTVLLLMGMGELTDFVDYFRASWLAGLCEGLEERRGMEIPDDFHLVPNLFWDLDARSVQYSVDQRVLRIVIGNEQIEKPHPFVAMSSAWIDGYSVGLQFDELKEEMLAQA